VLDLRLKRFAKRTIANDVADKIDSAAREFGASVDEIGETFECNQPADAHDSLQVVGRDRRARRFVSFVVTCFAAGPAVPPYLLDVPYGETSACRAEETLQPREIVRHATGLTGFGGMKRIQQIVSAVPNFCFRVHRKALD